MSLDELTKIVVTHNLDENLLKKYDSILVLKNGRIFEHGTFYELMEQKKYFTLPILEVDDKTMTYREAIKWVNSQG